MMKSEEKSRERLSSWIAFVWVASGAAVGLGNIWKFPYMAGSGGGSAFVLMYLVFVMIVAIPVMIAEVMLGKLARENAVDGFRWLATSNGRSEKWRFIGYLGLLTLQMIFCFYSVVAGWSIAYIFFALQDLFFDKTPTEIKEIWSTLLADPVALISWTGAFIAFTMGTVFFGVRKGIERACAIMMPCLMIVLLMLVLYSISSGGFTAAFWFLFSFEPGMIDGGILIASLGHAFFTLAVGACSMFVYGSYLPKAVSVVKSVLVVALLDILVALLAGLAILPLIFKNGLEPSQGPGLVFVSLPMVFAKIPLGWFWGSLFFFLLFLAALSSSLSFAEPLVDLTMKKLSISRKRSAIAVGIMTFLGSSLCALSFNVLAEVRVLGRFSIFDFFADISTNLLLPIGGIAIAIFASLVIKKADFMPSHQRYGFMIFGIWRFLVAIVSPIAIVIVWLTALYELF